MGDEESIGNSAGSSCATPLINWWDVHATSLSSNSWNTRHHHADANPHSNEDHHHHLSVSAPSDNQLWTHVLLGVGSNGEEELQNNQAGGEDLMDELSSKSLVYEPAACSNYLKKFDTTDWGYSKNNNNACSSSINSTCSTAFDHKHLNNNGFNDDDDDDDDDEAVLESERSSNLVSTWSIAPPDHNRNNTHFDPHQARDHTLNSCMDHHSSGVFSSYGTVLDMKVEQEHLYHHHASSEGLFGYHQNSGFNNNSHHQYGMMPSLSSSCSRNLTDVIPFTGRIGQPIIGIHALKPSFRPPLMTVSDSKKQHFHTSLPTRTSNGRGQGSSTEVIKKKRTDDTAQTVLKKPKQGTSTASSTKVQAPKVKLGDRITTLQQIVSPFGKTDTASVLFEANGYIKFLQEQVQLLSHSYMKTNSHKETWGSMERKEEKGDLKSRGLCLVPISWTPQSYRDNTAPDHWTPAYRGCLFR